MDTKGKTGATHGGGDHSQSEKFVTKSDYVFLFLGVATGVGLPLAGEIHKFQSENLKQLFSTYGGIGIALIVILLGNSVVCLITRNNANKSLSQNADSVKALQEQQGQMAENLSSMTVLHNWTAEFHPVSVAVSNFDNFFIYAPLYIANEFGLFKSEGIQIKIHRGKNDDAALNYLLEGRSQFAITDPWMVRDRGEEDTDPERKDKKRKGEAQIIAPLVTRAALWGLCKKPTLLAASQKLRIVTYPWPSTAYRLVEEWKKTKHREAEILNYSSDAVEALIAKPEEIFHHCDMICVTEPERSWLLWRFDQRQEKLTEIDFHKDLFETNGGKKDFYFTVVITTQSYLESSPVIVERFLKALRFACTIVRSADEKSNELREVAEKIWDHAAIAHRNEELGLQMEVDQSLKLKILKQLRDLGSFPNNQAFGKLDKPALRLALNLGNPSKSSWNQEDVTNDMVRFPDSSLVRTARIH